MPAGRRILVLPQPVAAAALASAAAGDLVVTDIGYYPEAAWHHTFREKGAPQVVLMYCVAGAGRIRNVRGEQAVGAGQVVALPAHRLHEYRSDPDRPWTIYWLHIAGRKTESIYRLLTEDDTRNVIDIGEDAEVVSLFEEVFQMLRQSYGPDHLLLASLCAGRLVARMILLHRQHPQVLNTRQRIDTTIRYMQQRLAARVSVPELSRLANLSRSHYAAAFKQQTGYAVIDYFLRLKMQRAAWLLDTTDRSVKAVAGELGFDDPLYFSRQFRRVYNVPPTEYRAIKKG